MTTKINLEQLKGGANKMLNERHVSILVDLVKEALANREYEEDNSHSPISDGAGHWSAPDFEPAETLARQLGVEYQKKLLEIYKQKGFCLNLCQFAYYTERLANEISRQEEKRLEMLD